MKIGIIEIVKGYAEAFGISPLQANVEVFSACEFAGIDPFSKMTEEQWLEVVGII